MISWLGGKVQRHTRAARTLLIVPVALLIGMPVITVLLSFTEARGEAWSHLAQTVLPRYGLNSLWILLFVGFGVLVLGTLTAWFVVMCRFPGRRFFDWALVLPLAMPAYVVAYAYTDFLQVSGPVQSALRDLTGWGVRDYWFPEIRSLGGAITIFILVLYPYVYLAARVAFLQQCECVLEASRTLGCSPWRAFARVALPMARPALAAGVALALMEALADFGTVQFFGVQTFTTGIYRTWLSMGDRTAAAQLAALLLGVIALLIVLEKLSRRQARFFDTSRRVRALTTLPLTRWRAVGAIVVCLVPVVGGFILPFGILVAQAFDGGDAQFGPRYFGLVGNSLTLAAITAVFCVGFALVLAYAVRGLRRGENGRAVRWADQLAGLGYAIPGSIIAVGVLIPLSNFDNALDAWARDTLGVSTGLLLTGSMAALIFAYVVRFLAVARQTVQAGMDKITPSMDAAAMTLGASGFRMVSKVHGPLLRGSLLTALLMVFVEVIKELPATLIMRPFNLDTLAVQAYTFASDERLSQAATPALTIVLVSMIPVLLLSGMISRSRPGHVTAGRDDRAARPTHSLAEPQGIA